MKKLLLFRFLVAKFSYKKLSLLALLYFAIVGFFTAPLFIGPASKHAKQDSSKKFEIASQIAKSADFEYSQRPDNSPPRPIEYKSELKAHLNFSAIDVGAADSKRKLAKIGHKLQYLENYINQNLAANAQLGFSGYSEYSETLSHIKSKTGFRGENHSRNLIKITRKRSIAPLISLKNDRLQISKISNLNLTIISNSKNLQKQSTAFSALNTQNKIHKISGSSDDYLLISKKDRDFIPENTTKLASLSSGVINTQDPEIKQIEDLFEDVAQDLDMDFIVSMDINYEETDFISSIRRTKDGDLLVPFEDLVRFEVSQDYLEDSLIEIDNVEYANISELENIYHKLNEEDLALEINFPVKAMKQQYYNARAEYDDDADFISKSEKGIFYNYDYTLSKDSGSSFVTGSHEIVYCNERGSFSTSFFTKNTINYKDQSELSRLETRWISDYIKNDARLRLGDSITRNSEWSSATRFAGIQYSTNFDLRPNLITYPLATFSDSTSLPSIVDIFANEEERAVFSKDVNTGKYFIDNIPAANGRSDIRVRVTDLNGREKYVNIPLYVTSELLKEGISDFSYSIGTQRQEFGKSDNEYRGLVTSLDYIYGVNDNWTTEWHMDGYNANFSAGVTNIFKLGNYGVFNSSVATNITSGNNGQKFIFGYQYQGKKLFVSTGLTLYRGQFLDIFAPENDGTNGNTHQLSLGYGAGDLGSFNISYSSITSRDRDTGEKTQTKILSAGYQKNLSKDISLRLSAGANLAEKKVLPYGALTLSFNMGNSSGSFSNYVKRGDKPVKNVNINYSNSQSPWGLKASIDDDRKGLDYDLQIDHKGKYMNNSFFFFRRNGRDTYQMDASGSAVAIDGGIYFTSPINDSIALVKVGEIEGAPVYSNNRLIGKTDKKGKMIVPDLASYSPTEIRVDENALPLDAQFSNLSLTTTPSFNSAVLVKFDIEQIKILQFVLVNNNGEFLPLNSNVEIDGMPDSTLVGYNGLVYVEGAAHLKQVSGKACTDGANCCNFSVPLSPEALSDEIIDLDEITCY